MTHCVCWRLSFLQHEKIREWNKKSWNQWSPFSLISVVFSSCLWHNLASFWVEWANKFPGLNWISVSCNQKSPNKKTRSLNHCLDLPQKRRYLPELKIFSSFTKGWVSFIPNKLVFLPVSIIFCIQCISFFFTPHFAWTSGRCDGSPAAVTLSLGRQGDILFAHEQKMLRHPKVYWSSKQLP